MGKNNGLMIKGNIWKQLVIFAIPLLIGNLFQQLYNTVDSVVVGNFIGDQALAAVNSSGPIIDMLVSFFTGLSLGSGVLISNYYGGQDRQGVFCSVHTAMALGIVFSLFATIVGIIFTPSILTLVKVDPSVINQSIVYLRLYFLGVSGLIIYNMVSGILRAVGDSRHPLYFLIVSSFINVVLDLLFVIVFKMGIAGVAIATSIAQVASAILSIYILITTVEIYRLQPRKIRFYWNFLKRTIEIGLPSALQNAVVSFSNIIMQTNINVFGAYAMAGSGSYTKIDGFVILPVISMSMALTTFVGQNKGANNYQRIKKGARTGILISCGIIVVLSVGIIFTTPYLLHFFSSNTEVINYGLIMMKCLVPGYIFLTLSQAICGILRGVGKTKIPMIVLIGCWCLFRVLWVMITVRLFHNIVYVNLGWPVSWVLSTIILLVYYYKVDWIKD
ncbi:MATE family efflux transporter [uncultured Thomasclavelia sp.]|uniref:MATE family efflux transporter n=1 Tax=uncultured Thomasclavelia sp. TaxID=3025759 RepID=UPI0025F4D16D|nr:MATE family efflux transporter [uncultured Thomasclavelia sp.]